MLSFPILHRNEAKEWTWPEKKVLFFWKSLCLMRRKRRIKKIGPKKSAVFLKKSLGLKRMKMRINISERGTCGMSSSLKENIFRIYISRREFFPLWQIQNISPDNHFLFLSNYLQKLFAKNICKNHLPHLYHVAILTLGEKIEETSCCGVENIWRWEIVKE